MKIICVLLGIVSVGSAITAGWSISKLKSMEEKVSRNERILDRVSIEVGDVRADVGNNHLPERLNLKLAILERDQKAILEREKDNVFSSAGGAIVKIANDCAGTPDEAFGKEAALFHAKKMEAVGALPFGTPQEYVDGSFKAARNSKKNP